MHIPAWACDSPPDANPPAFPSPQRLKASSSIRASALPLQADQGLVCLQRDIFCRCLNHWLWELIEDQTEVAGKYGFSPSVGAIKPPPRSGRRESRRWCHRAQEELSEQTPSPTVLPEFSFALPLQEQLIHSVHRRVQRLKSLPIPGQAVVETMKCNQQWSEFRAP